ncbi:MAG: hypothetical protein C4575_13450 [Desulforudis sp.]|jgi:CheY-like chemotaxis protein|nr:hypothetical protein [Clostridia bacterium]MDQ7791358.1 hypothetical protein [Clostridia bacterium]RJX17261.1 MAG: hypothetical protein C4575_13450 [Desulforudis sp.]
MSDNPVSVLLIEDNPADARLIREIPVSKGERQGVRRGRQVLAEIKTDPDLRRTPVVPPNQ